MSQEARSLRILWSVFEADDLFKGVYSGHRKT